MPFAPIRDLQMYYEVRGPHNAEPLLLHNGAFGVIDTDSDWGKLFDRFAGRFKLIAFEHRGHGRTNNPAGKYDSYEQLADDAAALLQYLEIPRAHVVGFSDGGITALKLAAKYPAMVDILVSIGANIYNTPGTIAGLQKLRGDYIENNFKEWAATLERQFASQGPGAWKEVSRQLEVMWLDDSVYPTPAEMQSIRVPTLVMTGQKDMFGTVEQTLDIHRYIEGSELCILPGVAHAVPVQRPELTWAVLSDFFDRQFKKRERALRP